MKLALLNFTKSQFIIGGCETRQRLLKRAMVEGGHACELIATSGVKLDHLTRATKDMDLVISDSAVGFVAECPMITVFGNAWRGVADINPAFDFWTVVEQEKKWHSKHQTVRVAVSNYIRDCEMKPSGIIADEVIINPVDIGRFPKVPTKKTPPRIFWGGCNIPTKGEKLFNQLREQWPANRQVDWTIACKNTPEQFDYGKMTKATSESSVMVLTSVAEGCSNILMEAIAADVPIVTTQTGLFWDFWDKRLGVLVTTRNASDLVKGVLTVLDNEWHPRQVAIDRKLDYNSWAKRWQELVVKVAHG